MKNVPFYVILISMMHKHRPIILFSVFFALFPFGAFASFSEGYILYAAIDGTTTTLIDQTNTILHTWKHATKSGYAVYLLENGNILRTAQVDANAEYPVNAFPVQGIIEEVDSSGKVLWSYQLANETCITHHDMKPMPNGHILACAYEFKNKADLIAVGMDTAILTQGMPGFGGRSTGLLSEMIFELDPNAEGGPKIVWQWHLWDHLVREEEAAAHPELFSTGITTQLFMGQWVHLNGIDYCAKTDLIAFTSRLFCEVYVIDHHTATEQAAGHSGGAHGKGGDLLYRWGHPSNYLVSYKDSMVITPEKITIRRGDTTITPAETTIVTMKLDHPGDVLNCLHCPTWIPEGYPGAGNILFFHNNSNSFNLASRGLSQVIEIQPPLDADGGFICANGNPFGPDQAAWIYTPHDSMQSLYMSSTFRLKNGNTLVHEAQSSTVREVTPDQQMVWDTTLYSERVSGGSMSMIIAGPAKIMYYPGDYIGAARLLNLPVKSDSRELEPGKTTGGFAIKTVSRRRIEFSRAAGSHISLYTVQGRKLASLQPCIDKAILSTRRLPPGACVVRATSPGKREMIRVVTIMR
ncbi:MAG: aryl-sulfate sulfotransferase [Chitinispirillaceae bacterium]|nr:aryl-sulfate sulfotransferase [Chitinispirillaceae bacterium]